MISDGFIEFCDFLKRETGITLEASKQYLVTNRLNRLMSERQIETLTGLLAVLKQPGKRALKQLVVEAMTTNETQWFRDIYPLQAFADEIIPTLIKNNQQAIRIWSAACSSGQEPYTISMIIEEHREMYRQLHLLNPSISIVGTDLSSQILEKAHAGIYYKPEMARGLSKQRQQSFFSQCLPEVGEEYWLVNQNVSQRVEFKQHNLLHDYTGLGLFDVILCRNVLIYFSKEIKSEILNRMAKQLKPDGYLILGSSESPSHYSTQFKMEKINGAVVYRLKNSL